MEVQRWGSEESSGEGVKDRGQEASVRTDGVASHWDSKELEHEALAPRVGVVTLHRMQVAAFGTFVSTPFSIPSKNLYWGH